MRKVIGALAIFSLALFAHAGVVEDTQRIDAIVKKAGAVTPCSTCGIGLAGEATPISSPARQCIDAICGPGSRNMASVFNEVGKAALTNKSYSEVVLPLIMEIGQIERSQALQSLDAAEAWLASGQPVKEKVLIRFSNFMAATKRLSKIKYKADGDSVDVDEEATRAAMKGVPEAEIDREIKFVRLFLKAVYSGDRIPSDAEALRLMPRPELESKIRAAFAEMESSRARFEKNPELRLFSSVASFRDAFDVDPYRDRLLGDTIDPYAIVAFNSNMTTAKLLLALVDDPGMAAALDGPPLDPANFAKNPTVLDGIAKRKSQISAPLLPNVPKCLLALATAEVASPSQAQIEAFKPRVGDLKKKFKSILKTFASDESAAKLGPRVDSWVPNFPRTREQVLAQIKSNLERRRDRLKVASTEQAAVFKGPNRQAYAALATEGYASKREDENEFSSEEEICSSLAPSIIPDASMSLYGTFSIGPMVVSNSPRYDSITMHEMGHLLEGELTLGHLSQKTRGWFDSTKTCLTNSRQDGAKYFKEDFADLISARDPSSADLACAFAADGQAPDVSLKNSSATDPHSSDFFRLLTVERYKAGGIPQACQSALQQKSDSLPTKICGASN